MQICHFSEILIRQYLLYDISFVILYINVILPKQDPFTFFVIFSGNLYRLTIYFDFRTKAIFNQCELTIHRFAWYTLTQAHTHAFELSFFQLHKQSNWDHCRHAFKLVNRTLRLSHFFLFSSRFFFFAAVMILLSV